MKYAVLICSNGNFIVSTEGHTTKESAIISYHDKCKIYHSAEDVITATIVVVDENMDPIDGGRYKEFISHVPASNTPQGV